MANQTDRPNVLFAIPRVTIGVGAALAALVILLTAAFWFLPEQYRGTVIFFGASLAAAGQIAAAFYAARTLQHSLTVESRRLDVEEKDAKRELEDAAYGYAARWTDASMFHIRKDSQDIIEMGMKELAGCTKYIEEDVNRKANIRNLLNFIEELAVAVHTERADEAVAKRLFCGIVLNIWNVCEEWAKIQRAARARPQLWIETEKLHQVWSRN